MNDNQQDPMLPIIPVCFWCAKPAVVFDGPHQLSLTSYTPCDTCMPVFLSGIVFIEVVEANTVNRPPINIGPPLNTLAPTGRYIVLNPDAFEQMALPDDIKVGIRASRRAFLLADSFQSTFGDIIGSDTNGQSDTGQLPPVG